MTQVGQHNARMDRSQARELRARFRSQYGVVTRRQLRLLGVSPRLEHQRVNAGEWERTASIVRNCSVPTTPEQGLMAACLAGGPDAVASHRSAAWLWGLCACPEHPEITVGRGRRLHIPAVQTHFSTAPAWRPVVWRGIPCTDPLRTLVDLAAVAGRRDLDEAVDRALARRLVTVEGLAAELDRVSRRGRRGVGVLRRSLAARGFTDSPAPSVLESRFLRLLRSAGIVPIGVEVVLGPDGRYRVDSLLATDLVAEVDGFAFHHTPEQVAADERRRRRLRAGGMRVLVFTWRDVSLDGPGVVAEIRAAMAGPVPMASMASVPFGPHR